MCERCYGKKHDRRHLTKKIMYCKNCIKPLKGLDNRQYPIHVSSVIATLLDAERWKTQGYDIIIEQQ